MEKLSREMEEAQQEYLFSSDGLEYLIETHEDLAKELRDGWAAGEQIETCERLGIDIWLYIADNVQFSMEEIYSELGRAANDIEAAQVLLLIDQETRGFWGQLALAAWARGHNAQATQYDQMGIAQAIQPAKWNTEFAYYGIAAEDVLGLCDYCLYPLTTDFIDVVEEGDLALCVSCGQEFRLRDATLLLLHATGKMLEPADIFLSATYRWVLWPAEYQ